MSRAMCASLFGLLLAAPAAVVAQTAAAPAGPTAVDLAGAWAGSLTHEEETTPLALELEPAADGKMIIKATIPAVHLTRQPIAREALQVQGQDVRVGPFTFRFDQAAGTLSGVMPEGLVPVYRIPFVLRRHVSAALPDPPEPTAPLVQPAWTYEAGSPLWAGAAFADGLVFAGGEDGRLHALDAVTGKARWSFQTGGAVRTRATVSRGLRACRRTGRYQGCQQIAPGAVEGQAGAEVGTMERQEALAVRRQAQPALPATLEATCHLGGSAADVEVQDLDLTRQGAGGAIQPAVGTETVTARKMDLANGIRRRE